MDSEKKTYYADAGHVNKIIAADVINERLAITPTPENIQVLADCITTLENDCAMRGEICS